MTAGTSPARVRVERVTKRFGMQPVLRPISFAVNAGERVVLFGANGAGKTTLLRILATLSRPTSGSLMIDDLPVEGRTQVVRQRIGVVAHQTYLYPELTAAENLHFFGRMYDVPDIATRINSVLERVGLAARRDDRVQTFSRGMQQRLSIGRAMLHQPTVLLLDEPDTGLDLSGQRVLAAVIEEQATVGGSVLVTTHNLPFGLAVADRVLLLERGRLVLDRPAGDVDVAEIDRRLVGT